MNSPGVSNSQEIETVVEQVSELLHRRIGLRPEPSLRGRLRRCIRDDSGAGGEHLGDYLDTLLAGGEALQSLLNRVTVQETAFFRHPEHFDLLAREILPNLSGQPVSIWSAACANGQEAFSLAMLLEEHSVHGHVIASDVSTEAVQRTDAARYRTRELGGLSPQRISRHLTHDGNAWLVNGNIRDRVSAFQHNLLRPIPHQVRDCQVVFCRNVLIYLSPDHAHSFLDRVADALPAASLFLGSAETIWQLSSRFDTVRSGDTFSYRCRVERSRDDPGVSLVGQSPNKTSSTSGTARSARIAPTRKRSALPTLPPPTTPPLTTPGSTTAAPTTPGSAQDSDAASAGVLARAGQQASAAGDAQAAVVAFRKCAYLAPDDPMAHLHLGLALESAGDQPSALRAYAAARHALAHAGPAHTDHATEGYTTADIIRLLDSKQRQATP